MATIMRRIIIPSTQRKDGNIFAASLQKRFFQSKSTAQSSSSSSTTPKPYVTEGGKTHFGFESVNLEDKESRVKEVFQNVAESYDVMNDIMSFGIHRYWKDELCSMSALEHMAKTIRRSQSELHPTPPSSPDENFTPDLAVLDVAGGTGDVAFRFLESCGCVERSKSTGLDPIQITVCDINPSMLAVGEQRARKRYGSAVMDKTKALRFVEGNAECLPFDDNSFDLYTIAFGLRNVTNVDQGLKDAFRVLKPGARYMCLEFSHLPNPVFQAAYDAYSFNLIPTMGEFVANDRASYQYLVESIRKFSNQEDLKGRMEAVGFENVSYTNFNQGIVAMHEGWKPL